MSRTKAMLLALLCSAALAAFGTLEDFTTYTEVDPNTTIGVAANTITWTALPTRDSTSYVYYDYGAAHFSADFSFRCIVNMSAASDTAAWGAFVALANAVNGVKEIGDASGDIVGATFQRNAGFNEILLWVIENGAYRQDASVAVNFSTDYYMTWQRDDDAGGNGTGRYTLYVCTTNYNGEAGSVLVDTLTLDCSAGEQNDYRYIYATNCYNDTTGNTPTLTGTVRNLDIGEAAASGAGAGVIIINMD